MSFGSKLSDALDALLPEYKAGLNTPTGLRQRIAYLRAPKTGVTDRRLAQLLGVKPDTLRAWLPHGEHKGRPPSKASREKIEQLYTQFRRINNRDRIMRLLAGDKVKITGDGQTRYMNIRPREWEAFIAAWSRGDVDAIDAVWSSKLSEIDSDPPDFMYEPEEVEIV